MVREQVRIRKYRNPRKMLPENELLSHRIYPTASVPVKVNRPSPVDDFYSYERLFIITSKRLWWSFDEVLPLAISH